MPRDPKAELLKEFDDFVHACFPGLPSNSHQYTSLRRAFLAGAMCLHELLSRQYESEEEAMKWIEALYDLGAEETKLPPDPKAN